jgi:hypothetical protein
MPLNLPGGKIIAGAGGYVNIVSATANAWSRLNVARWEMARDIRTFHKGHSGTYGAIASRITGLDWIVSGRVWWDVGNPPESLLLTGWGCGLQLGMGTAVAQSLYGVSPQQFYAAPSGILKRFTVTDSSEGNDDDVVFADFAVQGNSLIFQLPQQINEFNAYAAQLQALGEWTAPSWFHVMQ